MRPANEALIVIDVQNDFCPGGALAVPGGDEIVPGINALMDDFAAVVLTQDWHPAGHSSFASSHGGKAPYDMIDMPYGPQVLWPDHCMIGTDGAAFHADLRTDPADLIIRKGFRPADRQLFGLLRERPRNAHRAGRLPAHARDRGGDAGRPCHRLLRQLLGRRCRAAGLSRHRGDRPLPRHRP